PRRQDALAFAQSRRASLGRERDGFVAHGVLGHGAPFGSADLLLLAAPHSCSATPPSASRSRRESPGNVNCLLPIATSVPPPELLQRVLGNKFTHRAVVLLRCSERDPNERLGRARRRVRQEQLTYMEDTYLSQSHVWTYIDGLGHIGIRDRY